MVQHEFNNRIAAQRAILRVINRKSWSSEQLFGLSSKAIDRWVSVNHIESGSELVKLIRDVSAKLFFLANKSQEQVSDEYTAVRAEIAAIYDAIRIEFDGSAI
jgi:predicted transcriptional regulator